ncbi:MAG: hypothetical protein CM1200mP22_29230 [Dehalococcoidia bacterium]|nr:MAG: hypothetical protein CM1200mP22_29230 [Dehalococcoidia bacterium]
MESPLSSGLEVVEVGMLGRATPNGNLIRAVQKPNGGFSLILAEPHPKNPGSSGLELIFAQSDIRGQPPKQFPFGFQQWHLSRQVEALASR